MVAEAFVSVTGTFPPSNPRSALKCRICPHQVVAIGHAITYFNCIVQLPKSQMQGQSAFTDAASAARICPDCGVSYKRRNGRRCDTCAHTNYLYRAYGSGRELAIAAVLKARIAGALPSISTCTCVDCGAQAEHYEHRDYNQPLDVVPTCRSCNRRRGNAIPKSWSFDEFWAYYNTLSVSKREPFLSLTQDDFAPIRRKYFDAARAA